MRPYPKILGPYKRHTEGPDRNKLIIGEWSIPELGVLADLGWTWTEKVDGTNIRVHWDGHRVTFGGRTDKAQIPTKLLTVLQDTFREELFEQSFNDTEVTLYGEGFGVGIQKGGVYRPDMGFALFDVLIGPFWLKRPDVEDVAAKLGIETVPVVMYGSIGDAIFVVTQGVVSWWGNAEAEGLVGAAPEGLLTRSGNRIMVKIKRADFH